MQYKENIGLAIRIWCYSLLAFVKQVFWWREGRTEVRGYLLLRLICSPSRLSYHVLQWSIQMIVDYRWDPWINDSCREKRADMRDLSIAGAGMAQWWEHSPPTNVAWVRFPDSASYVGWVCCWFSSLLRWFFSGFSGIPPSTKTNISKFQFNLETVDE